MSSRLDCKCEAFASHLQSSLEDMFPEQIRNRQLRKDSEVFSLESIFIVEVVQS